MGIKEIVQEILEEKTKEEILEVVAEITILWAEKFPDYDQTNVSDFPLSMFGYKYLFTLLQKCETYSESLKILKAIKNFLEMDGGQ